MDAEEEEEAEEVEEEEGEDAPLRPTYVAASTREGGPRAMVFVVKQLRKGKARKEAVRRLCERVQTCASASGDVVNAVVVCSHHSDMYDVRGCLPPPRLGQAAPWYHVLLAQHHLVVNFAHGGCEGNPKHVLVSKEACGQGGSSVLQEKNLWDPTCLQLLAREGEVRLSRKLTRGKRRTYSPSAWQVVHVFYEHDRGVDDFTLYRVTCLRAE
jgi:hypothetical protein